VGDDAAAAPAGESKTGRGVGGARAGRAAAARTGEGRREREGGWEWVRVWIAEGFSKRSHVGGFL